MRGGDTVEIWGRRGLFSASQVSPRKLSGCFGMRRRLVTRGAGFIWEELENKGLQTQEAWRELRWRQARRSLNESGQRPIWNAGSKKLLPVVWDFSFWEGSMSDGRWFCPLFPPSLQQTRIEALKYRSESGMKPSPHGSPHSPGTEASRDLRLIALES